MNKHHFNNTFAFENHLKDKKSLKKSCSALIVPESVSIIPHPGMLEEFGRWFIFFLPANRFFNKLASNAPINMLRNPPFLFLLYF